MKRLLALAAIALLFTTCSKSPEDSYQALKEKAADQLANYEFDKAESTYIEILFADTTRFDGPIGLARSAERQLMHWDALHLYMKLTERNPRSAEASLGMMRVATRLGLEDMALDRAGTAMQLIGESDTGMAAVETARRLAASRQPNVARQLTERITNAGQPDAVAAMITARAFYREHQFDSAAVYLDKALADPSESSVFARVAADYYETTGEFDSALAFSRQAWDAEPTDFDVMVEHFYRALRLGYFDDARQVVKKVETDGGETAPAYMLRLLLEWETGEYYEAMATNILLLDKRPHTLTAHLTNLESNAKVSNYITCSAELQYLEGIIGRATYLPKFREFMRYRLAMINSTLDDQRVPLQQLQGQVANRTSELEHRTREAWLLYRIGSVDEVNARVDSALTLYESNPEWLTAFADVFGDSTIMLYAKARQTYEAALKLDPWYRPAVDGYIEMFRHRHMYDSCLALFDRFDHLAEHFADFNLDRAFYLALDGRFDAGTDHFLGAVTPLSGSIPKWNRMYAVLDARQAAVQQGRLTDQLAQALPEDPDALVLAARDLERREAYDRALQLTANGLTKNPDHPDLQAHHAFAMFKTGDEDAAFEAFEEQKLQNEDNTELLYCYSRALAESGRDPDKAQNEARRVVFSGPEVYRDFMNLAYVYMLTGRPDLARGEARRAMTAFPDRPEAYYYQGYSLYLENADGAKELLQKSLDLGLTGDDAERARDALQAL